MKYTIKPYIDRERIEKRVKELGQQITNDYKGKKLKIVSILKGSAPFTCDLIKNIDNDKLTVDFMCVSSYGSETVSSGIVKILKDLDKNIEGEDVIIIEDIIDTGYTLFNLLNVLKTRDPNSLKICTLLDKPSRRMVDIKSDYVGFEIEDKYIVGYGLDYDQLYRQLPYIGEMVFDEKS